jgi:hypothetical protein
MIPALVLCAACSVLGTGGGGSGAAQAPVQVTVSAKCAGPNQTEISVSPWNARLRDSQTLEWILAANANSEQLTVSPKRATQWPFAGAPYVGQRGKPVSAGRPNQKGRFSYNIQLICQTGSNAPDTVLVDPDVIID